MKRKFGKRSFIISLVVLTVILFLLLFVPGFVVLVTTLRIITVDTSSQWIGFWGGYLGGLIGAVTSLGVVGLTIHFQRTKDDKEEKQKLCEDVAVKISDIDIKAAAAWIDAQNMASYLNEPNTKDEAYRKYFININTFLQTKMLLKVMIQCNESTLKGTKNLIDHIQKMDDIVETFEIRNYFAKNIKDFFRGDLRNITKELSEECAKSEKLLVEFYRANLN